MKIYLVRHGQSDTDVEDRYGGDYDDNITELGKNQARALAKQLKNSEIETVYSSPRKRALEVAKILSESLDCDLETVRDLRERNRYGMLTGMKKSEAREQFPEQVALLEDKTKLVKNAEPWNDFTKRVDAVLEELYSKRKKTIAIVSHGGPISYIFREKLGRKEKEIGDCSYTVLEFNQGKLNLLESVGIQWKDQ